MPILLPREEFGRIHGVDERIPLSGIDEMVRIVSALIARWNTPGGWGE
jgi:acetylornithine deacetylase/succinyl-diaminopimelate desuccinylase-like protein